MSENENMDGFDQDVQTGDSAAEQPVEDPLGGIL